MTLRLNVLGGLTAGDGAQSSALAAHRKSLMLLAVIAAAPGGGISRDRLHFLFWPDANDERARNALKQRLFALRKTTGEDQLFQDGSDLRLNPAAVSVDLWDFQAAIRDGDAERTSELYTGPFLDGVFLSDLPDLERWIEEQRTRIAEQARRAMLEAARKYDEAGDRQLAVTWWRRLAAAEPTSAAYAIGLVEALGRAGDGAAALSHARIYNALVREELGAEPDPRVEESARRMQQIKAASTSDKLSGVSAREDAFKTQSNHQVVTASDPAAATPTKSPKRRMVAVGVLLVFVAALIVGNASYGGRESERREAVARDTSSKPQQAASRAPYVVAVIVVRSQPANDALHDWIYEVASAGFDRDSLVRVIPRERIAAVLRNLRVPERYLANTDTLAFRARPLTHAIAKITVRPVGGGFAVSSVLTANMNDEKIASFTADVKDTAMLRIVINAHADSATGALRKVKDLQLIRTYPTYSLLAIRLNDRAAQLARDGNFFEASRLWKAAVAEQPNFTGAWNTYSRHLYFADVLRAEMLTSARTASNIRSRISRVGEWEVAAVWHRVTRQYDSALISLSMRRQTAVDVGLEVPGSTTYIDYNELGNIQMLSREYVIAAQHYRDAAARSNQMAPVRNLAIALLNLGRVREADSALAIVAKLDTTGRYHRTQLASQAEATHDVAALATRAQQILQYDTSLVAAIRPSKHLMYARAMQGRIQEADSIAASLEARYASFDDRGNALAVVALRAMLHARVDNAALARQLLAEGERRYPLASLAFMDRPYPALVTAHVYTGNNHRARALVTEWKRNVPPEYRNVDAREMDDAMGELALAEGRPEEALSHFRTPRTGWCVSCDHVLIARAFDAMSLPDSALVNYRRYVDLPAYDRGAYDMLWLSHAQARIAQLSANPGNTLQLPRQKRQ